MYIPLFLFPIQTWVELFSARYYTDTIHFYGIHAYFFLCILVMQPNRMGYCCLGLEPAQPVEGIRVLGLNR